MNSILLILIILLVITAAISNAVMDSLSFHFYKSIFRKKNRRFWNIQESWKNKYKDYPTDLRAKFPLAKTALVFLTDAWHLFQFIMLSSFTVAILLAVKVNIEAKWYWYLIAFFVLKVIFGLVFELFFANIFKQKKQS